MNRTAAVITYGFIVALQLGFAEIAQAKRVIKIPCEKTPSGHLTIDQNQFERLTAPNTPSSKNTRIGTFQKLGEEPETGHVVGVCTVELK
jgi:hypothetical protein